MSPARPEVTRISLMLLDDHVIVREGLHALLEGEDDISVVAEAGSLRDAVETDVRPDVVMTDLRLPDAHGADVVARLSRAFPDAAILVLSVIDDPTDVQRCLAAGARGYLVKDTASREVTAAVRKVAAGEEYLQPSLGAALARSRAKRPARSVQILTPREREVLTLIARGYTNAEIAHSLDVSVRTVENHRASMMRRLRVRTRAELVRHAIDTGLL